ELPRGTEGELLVAAPSMLSALVGEELELLDGFVRTGDLAMMDSRGRVRLTGRLKLLIDVGGFKVNPLEVEQVLSMHPGVGACLVDAVRASDTVERVRARFEAIDSANPPGERELRAFLRERLSAPKVPRTILRVDTLPRTMTGKLVRAVQE